MSDPRTPRAPAQDQKDFCAFIDAEPAMPSAATDARIMRKVKADLQPPRSQVYGKFFFIEAFAGVTTLFVCPQFGLGFDDHNPLLHTLHENLNPFLFYLICGLIFVVLGAALSGLLLSRNEIVSIRRSRYAYYPIYALTAYFILTALGSEAVLISAAPWMLGSILGNAFGFGYVARMRLSI